jgi:hypothetical protein
MRLTLLIRDQGTPLRREPEPQGDRVYVDRNLRCRWPRPTCKNYS